ncbi:MULTISPECIES: hypothetical protein [unclassified Nostoc]|nr:MULTISPECIES: hypothetical protein [unclassified Nostoc]MDZ8031064.1 hypothetical protein [Nostoc sp. DedSLP04]MDZ8128389.1 hypothetical protein [Nostoc sp. DedQUE07]MDZ8136180.1 hypothetical protein [Nostoc sp. DedQUE04]
MYSTRGAIAFSFLSVLCAWSGSLKRAIACKIFSVRSPFFSFLCVL